jgi:hypothetical protein
MPGESKNGMQCAEFDALLIEALDHTSSASKMESFNAHARVCPVCSLLKAEAEEGQRWMKSLAEVEPPANLVHNILAATTGRESAQAKHLATTKPSWRDALTAWLRPTFGVIRQPRFVMSFGMAFFSLSAVFSLSGVKASDISHLDLRPTTIRRSYYETSGRVIKYYENIRFVYQIESRVRDFKRATTPAEPAPEGQPKERKNDTSEQPEQRQERNYSQGENQPVLASLPDDPPVVTMTTYRRFV